MKSSFTLVPFAVNTAPEIRITGTINRQEHQVEIEYQLIGNLLHVKIPQHSTSRTRQYDLWQHTCFEFFLGIKDSTQYWEFNLAPTGDWNVFYFENYRQDIAEETAFNSLPFQITQKSDLLQLSLEFELDKIITAQQNIEVGVTTVIEDKNQQLSYWALSHPKKEADFHHRDSFLINL